MTVSFLLLQQESRVERVGVFRDLKVERNEDGKGRDLKQIPEVTCFSWLTS